MGFPAGVPRLLLSTSVGRGSLLYPVTRPVWFPAILVIRRSTPPFTSVSLSGANSGYYFSHWEINGVRAADDVGIGLSQVSELMDSDKQIVAKYFEQNLDEDEDGMPDWYEWHNFGSLENGNLADIDNDYILCLLNENLGLMERLKICFNQGVFLAVVRPPSPSTSVEQPGLSYIAPFRIDPYGDSFLENNSTYATNTLSGLSHGYYFSHWEINGQRVADASGIGLGAASTVLDESKEIVAKFFDQYQIRALTTFPIGSSGSNLVIFPLANNRIRMVMVYPLLWRENLV